ncbi:MAG: bleomycin resistance protein [Bacteroidetes bacterium 47-18]|nr:MAG: bleomycin resistance protein [Bacteroidetes bacterium 47-18]
MEQKIVGFRTVIYLVSDIAAAKKWYAEAFGTLPYFDQPFYVGFNIAGYELGLQPEDGDTAVKTGHSVAYWGVEDVPAQLERLTALGAVIDEAPQDVGGDIIVARFKDPWGNIIGLIRNPHFALP